MTLALTKRQQVLFDRLVMLGDWASTGELPLDVLEIRGFGSFFRGTASPKDVDLFIRCHLHPPRPDFERFLKLLKTIRFDSDHDERFSTPKEALLFEHESTDTPWLPGIDNGEIERRRFGEWLEGYSWNMLNPQTIQQELSVESPVDYMKRMVKRRLPKLSIVQFLGPQDTAERGLGIRCGFTVSIWSKERPDMRANLEALLSEQAVTENTLRDLAYFEAQIPMMHAKVALMRAEVDQLLVTGREPKPVEPHWKWLEAWSEKQDSLRDAKEHLQHAEKVAHRFDDEEWGTAEPPAEFTALSHREAVTKADELRQELKGLYQAMVGLKDVRNCLSFYQSGCAKTDLPPREYVVAEMLSTGSARAKQRAAEFLQELGLLQDRLRYIPVD